VSDAPVQLPTPSDTATDASSVGDLIEATTKHVQRASKRLSGKQSRDSLQLSRADQAKNRTVSGETLVNSTNASQDSLLKNGIDSLNLPWNMSDVFARGSKADLLASPRTSPRKQAGSSAETLATVAPADEDEEDEEDEKERAAKAAARKAKMEENNRLWEKRKKIADKQATRRSARASMLTKAGELVSEVADTVLGKRKGRVNELKSGLRPRSTSESGAALASAGEPDAKKRRVSDGALLSNNSATPSSTKKPVRAPKDKKWLVSGLYAGQQRAFDARHHGGTKGKKKDTKAAEPAKEKTLLPLPMFFGERLLDEGRDFKLPFDVFSPLPTGQPKPDEWRKANKNIFVGEAAQEWRVAKPAEYSACLCTAETGCDMDCMNRYMYYECDSKNCNLKPEQCGNRAFDDLRGRVKKGGKYNIGVEVIKTADRGYGVRSNRTFDPHQIIVEYSGEVINQDECDRRMRKEYKNNEVSSSPPCPSMPRMPKS
jgi:[histone H3]-lysine4 N-trimethyltransferase ASH1L